VFAPFETGFPKLRIPGNPSKDISPDNRNKVSAGFPNIPPERVSEMI
jgi:hypothetical protein